MKIQPSNIQVQTRSSRKSFICFDDADPSKGRDSLDGKTDTPSGGPKLKRLPQAVAGDTPFLQANGFFFDKGRTKAGLKSSYRFNLIKYVEHEYNVGIYQGEEHVVELVGILKEIWAVAMVELPTLDSTTALWESFYNYGRSKKHMPKKTVIKRMVLFAGIYAGEIIKAKMQKITVRRIAFDDAQPPHDPTVGRFESEVSKEPKATVMPEPASVDADATNQPTDVPFEAAAGLRSEDTTAQNEESGNDNARKGHGPTTREEEPPFEKEETKGDGAATREGAPAFENEESNPNVDMDTKPGDSGCQEKVNESSEVEGATPSDDVDATTRSEELISEVSQRIESYLHEVAEDFQLNKKPDNPLITLQGWTAQAKRILDKVDNAIEDLERAKTTETTQRAEAVHHLALTTRAIICCKFGDYELAIPLLKGAADVGVPQASFELIRALMLKGEIEDASQKLEEMRLKMTDASFEPFTKDFKTVKRALRDFRDARSTSKDPEVAQKVMHASLGFSFGWSRLFDEVLQSKYQDHILKPLQDTAPVRERAEQLAVEVAAAQEVVGKYYRKNPFPTGEAEILRTALLELLDEHEEEGKLPLFEGFLGQAAMAHLRNTSKVCRQSYARALSMDAPLSKPLLEAAEYGLDIMKVHAGIKEAAGNEEWKDEREWAQQEIETLSQVVMRREAGDRSHSSKDFREGVYEYDAGLKVAWDWTFLPVAVPDSFSIPSGAVEATLRCGLGSCWLELGCQFYAEREFHLALARSKNCWKAYRGLANVYKRYADDTYKEGDKYKGDASCRERAQSHLLKASDHYFLALGTAKKLLSKNDAEHKTIVKEMFSNLVLVFKGLKHFYQRLGFAKEPTKGESRRAHRERKILAHPDKWGAFCDIEDVTKV